MIDCRVDAEKKTLAIHVSPDGAGTGEPDAPGGSSGSEPLFTSAIPEPLGKYEIVGILAEFAKKIADDGRMKDPDVISLFRELILPQFPFKDKTIILKKDAFTFLEKEKGHDCVFVDIWHDTADGTPLYLKAKALEKEGTVYRYWAEKSLLSAIRWREADAASGA